MKQRSLQSALSPQKGAVKVPITSIFGNDSTFNLKIERTTNTNSPVGQFPVPLFASIHRDSDWSALKPRIPANYTLAITEDSEAGTVTFTYTEGTNVIAFTVSSPTLPYLSALQALLKRTIKVSATRISVAPEANATTQFAAGFDVVSKNIFGGAKSNSLEIGSNVDPKNFQGNIVDVPQEYKLDDISGLIVYLDESTTDMTLLLGSDEYS